MTVTSMPQFALPPQHVPDLPEDVVLGVDTHKDIHVAVLITTLGAALAHQEFPTTARGYRQLISWARAVKAEGIHVAEINQPDRATRRKRLVSAAP
ncbi:hypothetical protein [Streptomyces chartreusis]|uniref:hypothetical protein n=1 Tax=Streptomyces chartreusis TaxID=1969 RepID=UPI00380DA5DA